MDKYEAYLSGYNNALKFAYIPDLSKELLFYFSIGFKDGKQGKQKTVTEVNNLEYKE